MAASIPQHKSLPTQKQGSIAQEKGDTRSSGRNRYIAETAEEKQIKNRDVVIAYIIKTTGCSSRDAMRKMSPFEGHEDVIASFAGWIEQKKGDNFAVRGYTPNMIRLVFWLI